LIVINPPCGHTRFTGQTVQIISNQVLANWRTPEQSIALHAAVIGIDHIIFNPRMQGGL
jgi:hypothetical protein